MRLAFMGFGAEDAAACVACFIAFIAFMAFGMVKHGKAVARETFVSQKLEELID